MIDPYVRDDHSSLHVPVAVRAMRKPRDFSGKTGSRIPCSHPLHFRITAACHTGTPRSP
jgi:hypothetical protein